MSFKDVLPAIVAILYLLTAFDYLVHKEWAWALMWASYATANIGLILISQQE